MSLNEDAASKEESKTIFTKLAGYFPAADKKLNTLEFLEASAGVVCLVEKFGKTFAPVVNDLNGNIKKLKQKYNEDPKAHEHLEDMILKEQAEGKVLAIDALLWLRRGLHFLCTFFQYIIQDANCGRFSDDLTLFMKRAYSETLEPYHGWLGTQLFNILSRFTPNRKSLFYALALDTDHQEKQVLVELIAYHQRMMGCVVRLTDFYEEHRLDVT